MHAYYGIRLYSENMKKNYGGCLLAIGLLKCFLALVKTEMGRVGKERIPGKSYFFEDGDRNYFLLK